MQTDINNYIDNNLFTRHYLEDEIRGLFKPEEAKPVFEALLAAFDEEKFRLLSENQLEAEWIAKILGCLGYAFQTQFRKLSFGKTLIPDFALFANAELKDAGYSQDNADCTNVLAFCEAKAYDIVLDNKKIDLKSPHFQLIDYLTKLKINFGFLTNGKYWRFYDVSQNVANKVFFEINLTDIFKAKDFEAFLYFYTIFHLDRFKTKDGAPALHTLVEGNKIAIANVERDLKAVIYGKDSIVEQFGRSLYRRLGEDTDLGEVYQNAVTFCFRLLFVAYFEDKFHDTLFDLHFYYRRKSLHLLLDRIAKIEDYPDPHYSAWSELQHLFQILDKGEPNLDIPLLNGGLFSAEKAKFLQTPKAINNADLRQILDLLLLSDKKTRRDFRTLSVQHLGNIYEGLLEFEFRLVVDSALYYLTYTEAGKFVEGYFDSYDYAAIKANKKITNLQEIKYSKGDIYFSDRSSNRKTTASYYTPPAFTQYMAKEAIAYAQLRQPNILKWRILDNACGSGHFLIETLDQVTRLAYELITKNNTDKEGETGEETNKETPEVLALRHTFAEEKQAVFASVRQVLGFDIEIDEISLLKRLMLKKVIYGLDLNAFAVELSRLSLWLDTFIIGTPLSFIEHHIRQGNALVGSTKAELTEALGANNLFKENILTKINDLVGQLLAINDLRDNNAQDIASSKATFQRLAPALARLNRILNLISYQKMLPFVYDKATAKTQAEAVKTALDNPNDFFEQDNAHPLSLEIDKIAQQYLFFNYEIAFAEAFANPEDSGFHIVIGNPPWDVAEFNEAEFFSVWRSSYRTKLHSEKKEIRDNVLEYPLAAREYEERKNYIINTNNYYQSALPLSSGKGNLFRFFLEHNLRLVHPDGSLNYLTPSAWTYEDSSITLRKYIFEQYQTRYFYQFENREKIFDRVDSRYKFAAYQIAPNAAAVQLDTHIRTRFMQTDINILLGQEDIIPYPIADIVGLSPLHSSLFEVRTAQDLAILRKLYAKFEPINTEYIDFRNELNMTNDRDIFLETCANPAQDWQLHEGKTIHQYNAKFAAPNYWVNADALKTRLTSVETSRLIGDIYEQLSTIDRNKKKGKREAVLLYLGMKEETELLPFLDFDFNYPRLAFRDIARNTDKRSIIMALLPPKVTLGHTASASVTHKYCLTTDKKVISQPVNMSRVLFIQAVLNSFITDFAIRFLIDIHVSKTYLMRLPMPQPSDAELQKNAVYQRIVRLAAMLNLQTAGIGAYGDMAAGLGIVAGDLPTTQKQRDKIAVEIDCAVARLYGISREELAHLVSPAYFKIFNEQNAGYIAMLLETYT
jgi:hypothetical protein